MFKLMVSFDCGIHYDPFMESNNCKQLEERTKKEDINWTRWYIEEDGKPVDEIICPIHKNIFDMLKKLNSV